MDEPQPGAVTKRQLITIIGVATVGIVLGSILVMHYETPQIKNNALGHMQRDTNGLPVQPPH
jgi:hypothetical protein